MTNLLSKTLVFGAMASTFLIINCQKAPERKAAPNSNPTAQQTAAKTTACTPQVLPIIKDRLTLVADMMKMIADGAKLDAAQKEALKNKVPELKTKTDSTVAAIRSLKVGNDPADECTETDAADPKKITKHTIATINQESVRIGGSVKTITGAENIYTQGRQNNEASGDPTTAALPVVDNTKLTQGQVLEVSKALGESFDSALSAEKIYVVAGNIMSSRDRAEQLTAMEADKTVSYCKITVSEAKLEEKARVTVTSISRDTAGSGEKGDSFDIMLTAASKVYGMKCFVLKGLAAETTMRGALGSQVTVVRPTTP